MYSGYHNHYKPYSVQFTINNIIIGNTEHTLTIELYCHGYGIMGVYDLQRLYHFINRH